MFIAINRRIMYIHKVGKYEVIFDSVEDYDLVTNLGGGYGKRKIGIDARKGNVPPYAHVSFKNRHTMIHHMLAGIPINKRMVDHINHNSLDNRRSNLRVVTRSENGRNCKRKVGSSGYRGVLCQKNGKFTAIFRTGLGTFETAKEASEVLKDFYRKNNIIIPPEDS